MIHDHYMYKNDPALTKKYIHGMKSVLDWWISKVDSSDMPSQMEWWNFTDWAKEFKNGIPEGADNGHSASIALQFVKTLQYATVMFRDLGYEHEALQYEDLEKKILKSTIRNCYDSQKGLLAETPREEIVFATYEHYGHFNRCHPPRRASIYDEKDIRRYFSNSNHALLQILPF